MTKSHVDSLADRTDLSSSVSEEEEPLSEKWPLMILISKETFKEGLDSR